MKIELLFEKQQITSIKYLKNFYDILKHII